MDIVASEVRTASVSFALSGDNTLIAAPGNNKKIRVLDGEVVAASAVDLVMKDGMTTAYTGATALGTKVRNLLGQKTLSANEALIGNLSGAVACVAVIRYVILDVV